MSLPRMGSRSGNATEGDRDDLQRVDHIVGKKEDGLSAVPSSHK